MRRRNEDVVAGVWYDEQKKVDGPIWLERAKRGGGPEAPDGHSFLRTESLSACGSVFYSTTSTSWVL